MVRKAVRQRLLWFLFSVLSMAAMAGQPARQVGASVAPQRWALVIGVGQYASGEIRPTPFSVEDSRDVASVLSHSGYKEVCRVSDDTPRRQPGTTAAAIRRQVQEFLGKERIGSEDLVLVYFSGHAFSTADGVFLAAQDTSPDQADSTAVSLAWLRDQLAACRAGRKVLLLDAPHGKLQSGGERVRAEQLFEAGQKKGIATLAACRGTQTSCLLDARDKKQRLAIADDWTPGNANEWRSAFSFWVARGLGGMADSNQDRKVAFSELQAYVGSGIAQWAEAQNHPQTPAVHADVEDFTVANVPRTPPAAIVGTAAAITGLFGILSRGSGGAGGSIPGDVSAPSVVRVKSTDDTHIMVVFDEPVDPISSTNTANYQAEGGLAIVSAELQPDGTSVVLTTSEQSHGVIYSLSIKEIKDTKGNLATSSTGVQILAAPGGGGGPRLDVVSATVVDSTHVDVLFSRNLDPGTANTAGNYSISPTLAVSAAALRPDGNTVRLTVAEQQGGAGYTVTVTGVRDKNGDLVSASNSATFTGVGAPPQVTSATAVDSTHVDVFFNETLGATSANVPGNYSISPTLAVTAAALQADGRTVRLATPEQRNGVAATVTVSGVTDLAGNPIGSTNNSAAFTGIGVPPTVTSATAVSSTQVDVLFGEPLTPTTAQAIASYAIGSGLAVTGATVSEDGRTVSLTTAEQRGGVQDTVTVAGVTDLAGNPIGNTGNSAIFTGIGVPPTVTSATAMSSTQVDVLFGEPLNPTTAQAIASSAIGSGLAVTGATVSEDGRTVSLTTAEQRGGVQDTVTVAGVTDLAGNPIGNTGNSAIFTGIGVPPTVTSATAMSSTQVDVLFSEPLNPTTAQAIASYAIGSGLAVTGATVSEDGRTVSLTTAEQRGGVQDTVTVAGVTDLAGNPIGNTGNSAIFTGIGVPPTVTSATAVDSTQVDVVFSEVIDEASAETPANYSISPGLAVTDAVLQPDGLTVRLTTDEQTGGTTFTVTVTGVTDLADSAIAEGNTGTFVGIGRLRLTAAAVSPGSGTSSQGYTYTVTYTQGNNVAPAYVRVTVINPGGNPMGTWEMSSADPANATFADGAVYQWHSSVLVGGPGAYSFRIEASDGTLTAAPAVGSGPDVSGAGAGRVVFASTRDGNSEVYVMGADGTGQTRLTDNGAADASPSWSPDGSRVVFHSDRDGNSEIYVMEADGTGQTRLTSNGAADTAPSWSPDGTQIAFVSVRNGNPEIYVMRADGTGQRRLTNHPANDSSPAWSPDGQRISFQSDRDGTVETYVMAADGSGQARLTNGGAAAPAWSSDGGSISFHSDREGKAQIFAVKADGTGQRRLTNDSADDARPAWSPDNACIAFDSDRAGMRQVWVMNADGTAQVAVASSAGDDLDPAWVVGEQTPAPYSATITSSRTSIAADGAATALITVTVRDGGYRLLPGAAVTFATTLGTITAGPVTTDTNGQATATLTAGTTPGNAVVTASVAGLSQPVSIAVGLLGGRLIAFDSNRNGGHDVFVMNPDGTAITRITDGTSQNREPAWSPNGDQIAFSTNRDGNWELYVMDADGSNQKQLTASTPHDTVPEWSPNGVRIVFESQRNGAPHIYVMDANGSNQTDLAQGSGPSWCPDNTRIVFSRNPGLWIVNDDGSGLKALTSTNGDRSPAWSPDGTRIAFVSNGGGGQLIYVINADGSGLQRLTSAGSDEAPAWSADGKEIFFASDRDGGWELYVMQADGTGQTRLTSDGAQDGNPSASSRDTGITRARPARSRQGGPRLRAVSAGMETSARLTIEGLEPDSTSGRATALRFVPMATRAAGAGLRSAASGRSWEFAIEATTPGAEVTLSWPDLAGLGSRSTVMLEDLNGGVRRSMRTSPAYTFRVGEGGRRRFRVVTQPRTGLPVAIFGLDLSRLRSDARAVRFTLSAPATIDLDVLSPQGGMIAQVTRGRASDAGVNQVIWSGTAAPGIYMIRARATAEDGTTQQAIRPVVITR